MLWVCCDLLLLLLLDCCLILLLDPIVQLVLISLAAHTVDVVHEGPLNFGLVLLGGDLLPRDHVE